MIKFITNFGEFVLSLDHEKAPNTAKNFMRYVESGFYDDTIFHRVINNFMIQGGGFDTEMNQKTSFDPIENEANNGLKNTRGSIAMARTNEPHSASSQFFINVVDNPSLDFKDESISGWGYCVFGEVSEGMDVIDRIKEVPTGVQGYYRDVPSDTVLIEKVEVIK